MKEENIKITKKILTQIEELTKELFTLIGLKVDLEVSHDEENEAVSIELKNSEYAGLIIGRRGETISALQQILGMMVRVKFGGWTRIVLNIGDFRQKQEEQLTEMANTSAERARETGQPQSLYNLNPSQRRIIHMILSNEKDLTTESEGDGRDRHLVITVKQKSKSK